MHEKNIFYNGKLSWSLFFLLCVIMGSFGGYYGVDSVAGGLVTWLMLPLLIWHEKLVIMFTGVAMRLAFGPDQYHLFMVEYHRQALERLNKVIKWNVDREVVLHKKHLRVHSQKSMRAFLPL